MSEYLLKLYIAGRSKNSELDIANIQKICEEELANLYQLEVVDVLEHPQLAEDERIIATPTLIRSLPKPLRRVIGDLSDKEMVILGLDLSQSGTI